MAVSFSAAELAERLDLSPAGSPTDWFGAVTRTDGGGVDTMVILGREFSGTELRSRLGLRSTAFEVAVSGKTITINFYKGDGIKLVDLPGYGYAKASNAERDRWGKMINGYFTSGRNIPPVVQLIDMRHKPSKDDLQMLQFLMETNTTFIVALTKSDKLNKTQYREALAERSSEIAQYGAIAIIPFSAKTGEGAETIRQFIADSVKYVS